MDRKFNDYLKARENRGTVISMKQDLNINESEGLLQNLQKPGVILPVQ